VTRAVYGKISANPNMSHKGLLEGFLSRKRAERAEKLIPAEFRKGRLLDIGCGITPYFLTYADFKEKYGIDRLLEPQRIKGIKGEIELLPFDLEKITTLPFPGEYFSVVTMLAVFEHIEPNRLPFLINEIFRVLTKDGIYILTTPAAWTDGLLKWMAKFGLVDAHLVAEHKGVYPPETIRAYLEDSPFSAGKLAFGSFEAGVNTWAAAQKLVPTSAPAAKPAAPKSTVRV
jgi:SAM-dependent methyltransferase